MFSLSAKVRTAVVGLYVESDDDRTRGSCQHYVGFGHSTYARMNYLYSYVFIV